MTDFQSAHLGAAGEIRPAFDKTTISHHAMTHLACFSQMSADELCSLLSKHLFVSVDCDPQGDRCLSLVYDLSAHRFLGVVAARDRGYIFTVLTPQQLHRSEWSEAVFNLRPAILQEIAAATGERLYALHSGRTGGFLFKPLKIVGTWLCVKPSGISRRTRKMASVWRQDLEFGDSDGDVRSLDVGLITELIATAQRDQAIVGSDFQLCSVSVIDQKLRLHSLDMGNKLAFSSEEELVRKWRWLTPLTDDAANASIASTCSAESLS